MSLNKGIAAMLGSQLNPRELNSILMQMFPFIVVEKCAYWSGEWKHFKFCFLNTHHVMLSGELSFVFAELMRTSARAENEISKKLFPGVSLRGLYREDKMYKLKRSIALPSLQPLAVGSAGARFSKVPKVFGHVLGDNSLCLFKPKASRDTLQLSLFWFPLQHMRRTALQNKQVGVLRMASRARKFFGLSRSGPLVRCDCIVSRKTFNRNMIEIERVS